MSSYDHNRLIVQLALLEVGVIPFPEKERMSLRNGSLIAEIREQLNSLTEEEQRVAKRKFRKLHRKVRSEIVRSKKSHPARVMQRVQMMNKKHIVDGVTKISAKAHEARNREVWMHMMHLASQGKL